MMRIQEKLKEKRVVLVEDNPWIRNSLGLYFQSLGCPIRVFERSGPALDALQAERFDVIISDYWLPDIDGLSLLVKARQLQPDAVRILMTAYPVSGLRDEAVRQGIGGFIQKPVTAGALELSLDSLLA